MTYIILSSTKFTEISRSSTSKWLGVINYRSIIDHQNSYIHEVYEYIDRSDYMHSEIVAGDKESNNMLVDSQ